MSDVSYICPSCCKRFGDCDQEGITIEIKRCPKHEGMLTSAQRVSRGISGHTHQEMTLRIKKKWEKAE